MKCPNCNAEVKGSHCSYCGSELPKEPVKKAGCPKCGSTNTEYKRERQGEIKGNNSKHSLIRTVGMCKDCGNTWYTDTNNATNNNQTQKKKTWLWVLGWICVFPIPLTILLLRKKEMQSAVKYGVIAVSWIAYVIIALFGGSDNKTPTTENNNSSIVSEQDTVNSEVSTDIENSETSTTNTETESEVDTTEEIKYADDKVVNQFIIDFQETAGYDLTDIKKGNIRTKYFAYANNCYIEMLNATENYAETFNISYSFGSLTEEEIYAFFTDCLKTLGATDEEIEQAKKALTVDNEGDYMIENYEVNSFITCTYCPTKELSNGKSIGHIEIASSAYGK